MIFGMRGPSQLELALERAIRDLNRHVVADEGYMKTMDLIIKLHKMKIEEKASRVSRDTLVLVGANLLGIFMIIKHEHVNVITSRAIGLLLKPR